jgi:glycosyltransferase involved in cell wall biosynthesis
MRIAFFCWEYYPRLVGGLGTYAIEITKKFTELGHGVYVFTQNTGELPTSEQWKGVSIHRPLTVDVHDLIRIVASEDLLKWGAGLKLFCDIFSYNYLSATKFINDIMRRRKEAFNLACVHDWLSAIAGMMIKDELNGVLPLVFHIHSTEEQRAGGGGSEVIKKLERGTAELADLVITVSFSMKNHLISLGYPANKIEVCWNGCDPQKYNPVNVDKSEVDALRRRYGIKPEEKVVLFIGRLAWVKGIHNLIQAFPDVLASFPNTRMVVLGKGEQYDYLVSIAKRLGIEERVIFRSEWVSEKERIAHYAMADVCVFPSLSEPFGIVSLEAMAMERPVVVSASGISGFKEQVVPDGVRKCGVHVDGNKPSDIAWGIRSCLENPDEAAAWGKNGRKRVLELFTWDKVTRETLSLYERLIASKR